MGSAIEKSLVETSLGAMLDWIFTTNSHDVERYVQQIRLDHPLLDRRDLAQKMIDEQSINNGLLGAATGLGGVLSLPILLPLDIIKAWKIHDFMIQSIAHLYGYHSRNSDLKTAIALLISSGSIEEFKQVAVLEASHWVNQSTHQAVDLLKSSAIQVAASEAPKYAAQAFTKALCKMGGIKVGEKALQESFGLVAPVVGVLLGGSVDWVTTQALGKLAIEYFEHSNPELIQPFFVPAA